LQKEDPIMTVKSLIQLSVAGLALALPLAASSTASARAMVRDHRVSRFVRNAPHLVCPPHGYFCRYGGKPVPHPIVRDHRHH
jgi:hypothetical protein